MNTSLTRGCKASKMCFKKDTGELFAAEFKGDRVRLISTGGNVAAVESILSSQGVKDFRNMLIDMLGIDEGLKW